MTIKDEFSGNVDLEDLKKVFRAHGVDVQDVLLQDQDGDHEMVQVQKGDLIDVFDADVVIYAGKAHRLARRYGVPIPDLYKADQFKSRV